MIENFRFGRLDRNDRVPNFTYKSGEGTKYDWSFRSIDMTDVGTHWSITIRNYMREDLLLLSSLRAEPIRIESIYARDRLMLEDTNNFVVIILRQRQNEYSNTGGSKVKTERVIEIKCPGHYLQTNSLFIDELGFYATVENRLSATRECIAQDARFPNAKEVSLPDSALKPDPVRTFRDYETLIKNCIERIDKIQVRVGVKLDGDPDKIPDYVKSMRISVLDKYFCPYASNKMCYDPSLLPNEFVVENLHFVCSEPIISTWERLHDTDDRAFFVDTQEHHSLGGVLCGLAIFADLDALQEYLFKHKSEEIYDELTQRLVDKTGSHALREKLVETKKVIEEQKEQIEQLNEAIKFEKTQHQEQKRIITILEGNLKKIQSSYDEINSYETIMADLQNQREKIKFEREKLEHDRIELENKAKLAPSSHMANMFKIAADFLKSGWGIAATIGAIYVAYVKLKTAKA